MFGFASYTKPNMKVSFSIIAAFIGQTVHHNAYRMTRASPPESDQSVRLTDLGSIIAGATAIMASKSSPDMRRDVQLIQCLVAMS
jgi:hypothetical protein